MVNLKDLEDALVKCVRPQTYPLAVKLCTSSHEVPDDAKRPKRDFGKRMPVCQVFSMARRLGYVMALCLEDQQCALGNLILGFLPPKKAFLDGSFHWSVLRSKEANARYSQAIRMLEYKKYMSILVAPIHRAAFKPDFVLMYGSPAQIEKMVQARLFNTGGLLMFRACLGGTCAAMVTDTVQSDECQVVLLGNGPLRIAHDQDHEIAFTIPANKFELLVQGLQDTQDTIYAYPVRVHLDYEYKSKYERLHTFLTEEDDEYKCLQETKGS